MGFVPFSRLIVGMAIVLHAHHLGKLLKREHAVAVFVKDTHDELAPRRVSVIVFHGFDVFNEVFQFLEGKAAAVVGVRFVEHGHQEIHHVFFHGFFQWGVLVFVVMAIIARSLVLGMVLIVAMVMAIIIIVLHVPCDPELVPGKVAVVVRIKF